MNGQAMSPQLRPAPISPRLGDGPPTDPKVFEEQQKKLQDELQKRAEEARKKLESQQPQAAAPGLRRLGDRKTRSETATEKGGLAAGL